MRTGRETGTTNQIAIPTSGIVTYNELFYYVNGSRLVSLDPEGLKITWSYTPQRRNSSNYGNQFPHRDGIAIDPENKLLYTTDKRYALCIELPD
ncbi:hypothetical protein KUV50_08930 [Membranicola marinus]|uniref:Uncharacterized protein n=1 Tax=Membranihabitans marinus TaxID=1227546 RepID=A0A953HMA4_9BACT|nr:hypothetical protein [Membranihabitans marinus]MBY5958252.1 hypothetical protein [Membranihabitans marinus]